MKRWIRAAAFRVFTWAAPKAGPPAPEAKRVRLGVNLGEHALPDLLALDQTTMTRPPLVRLWDVDSASTVRMLRLHDVGISTLAVLPVGHGGGPVLPGMALQLGHEPDRLTEPVTIAKQEFVFATDPKEYGALCRRTVAYLRDRIPPSTPIVAGGFSATASVAYMAAAIREGAGDCDAICYHVDAAGDLLAAWRDRTRAVLTAMEAVDCTKPLWVTQLCLTEGAAFGLQAEQLEELLTDAQFVATVDRAYLYRLPAPIIQPPLTLLRTVATAPTAPLVVGQ